jgi:glucose-6-phosphate-specific signal transduction histidine kinase
MAEYWALLFIRASATFQMHREKWNEYLVQAKEKIESDKSIRQQLANRYSFLIGRNVTECEISQVFQRVIPNLMTESEMRHEFVNNLQRRIALFSRILLSKPWQVWISQIAFTGVGKEGPLCMEVGHLARAVL